MKTVGLSHRLKRAWLDDVLDRLAQTMDEKELRAFVDQRLREELPGKDARAKATGIILRIWSGVDPKHVALRNRAVALLPHISGRERIWLHWGMSALAYPFFRDVAEVIGRILTLQDDFTTAQVQSRLKTAWGDRATSKDAAQKLITSMADWEVLRATKLKGHFLLARKMNTTVTDLQLWLLEAVLSASDSDEIEAQQLLRLPELFPFTFTVTVGDLRKHEGFNIHRQGLDMDMVAVRQVRAEPPPAKPKKSRKKESAAPGQPTFFDEPKRDVIPIGISADKNEVDADAKRPKRDETFSSREQQAPYRVLVLVRNLNSTSDTLNFGEFVLTNIQYPQHLELRERFSSQDVYINDWLLEKTYTELPGCPGNAPSGVGGIPNDIEDILFLLRLFKVGDIAFVKQAVVKPDGNSLVQFPYRLVNGINSNSLLTAELSQDEPDSWAAFANDLRTSESWDSQWFSVARRFFLYGGAKEFNPGWSEVDRIVDYATALEAVLVPERDFSRSRSANRAAKLCSSAPDEQKIVASFVKKLYDIRSAIVHGSVLSDEYQEWLTRNSRDIERLVRQVLVAAVLQEPPDDDGRMVFLQSLFDVTDSKRAEFAVQMFSGIKSTEARQTAGDKISKLATAQQHDGSEVRG